MALIRFYRIVASTYAADPYSGIGGLHASGRWHSQGRLVCYASDSLALATLEQIGRAGRLERLKELVYVPAEIEPELVHIPDEDALPPGWDRRPPGKESQQYGDAWLLSQRSIALRVPSVILPEGYNYVINPAFPGFREKLTIGEARLLNLDARVMEGLAKA